MQRSVALVSALALSACAVPLNYQASRHEFTLANDPDAPQLALLEHRLYREFAQVGDAVTVCAARREGEGLVALAADEEERLILRFPQLAPFDRCTLDGGQYRDDEAGRSAHMVEIFDFSCESATHCFGSAGWRPRQERFAHTEYELTYRGYWQVLEYGEPIVLTSGGD